MTLSTLLKARVATVAFTFVKHLKVFRRKFVFKSPADLCRS